MYIRAGEGGSCHAILIYYTLLLTKVLKSKTSKYFSSYTATVYTLEEKLLSNPSTWVEAAYVRREIK